MEALGRGTRVALTTVGNADVSRRPEFAVRPVRGIPPSESTIAWRDGDPRGPVHDFELSCIGAAAGRQAVPRAA